MLLIKCPIALCYNERQVCSIRALYNTHLAGALIGLGDKLLTIRCFSSLSLFIYFDKTTCTSSKRTESRKAGKLFFPPLQAPTFLKNCHIGEQGPMSHQVPLSVLSFFSFYIYDCYSYFFTKPGLESIRTTE